MCKSNWQFVNLPVRIWSPDIVNILVYWYTILYCLHLCIQGFREVQTSYKPVQRYFWTSGGLGWNIQPQGCDAGSTQTSCQVRCFHLYYILWHNQMLAIFLVFYFLLYYDISADTGGTSFYFFLSENFFFCVTSQECINAYLWNTTIL